MKKKIKVLEQRIADIKVEVVRLEIKLQMVREKDQHEKIEKKLDGLIGEGTHKWDDIKRLASRVSNEIKLIMKGKTIL